MPRKPLVLDGQQPVFREEQRFRQPWIWLLTTVSLLPVVAVFGYGLVQQLVFGRPFGDRPMSDAGLVLTTGVTLLFSGALLWLLGASRLTTVVSEQGVSIRFAPFHRSPREFSFGAIARAEATTYAPIREYGGWGIRGGRKGRAYNVSGNRGVLLTLREGKPTLIGSQRADELAEAILARLHHEPLEFPQFPDRR